MAMQGRRHEVRLSDRERSAQLTAEVEEWKGRGYRVQSRTATAAHLIKPRGGVLLPILCWLILSGLAWFVFAPIYGLIAVLVVCGAALIVILAWQSGRRDEVVQLTVDPDGAVYRE